MDIVKNHTILTASLFDTAACKALAQDEYIKSTGFTTLKPGWNVLLLYLWLSQKMRFASLDVINQMLKLDQNVPRRTIAQGLLRCAKKDLVQKEGLQLGVYGGNITTPIALDFKLADMEKVLELVQGHPLLEYLSKHVPSKFGANILAAKKIEPLISLIDFEIPSISCLLQTLGYPYLVSAPFLDQGIVIGRSKHPGYYSVLYGGHYKILTGEVLAALASEGLLKQPLSIMQCVDLGIETNHYRGEQ